jgi:hypothetical protein
MVPLPLEEPALTTLSPWLEAQCLPVLTRLQAWQPDAQCSPGEPWRALQAKGFLKEKGYLCVPRDRQNHPALWIQASYPGQETELTDRTEHAHRDP